MSTAGSQNTAGTVLVVGASRGLGHAMVAEFAMREWDVVGTVRRDARTKLHDLVDEHPARIEIETLDITDPDGVAALHGRLSGRSFDILFVNAGIANEHPDEPVARTSREEFLHVMATNVWGVTRAVEGLQDLVRPEGLIGVMSSGQGSITNNTRGGREVYRGSKAALNQCIRSYAARRADGARALVLLAPGWIRTELGGPEAPYSVEESTPKIVDVLLSQLGRPGLQYLDRDGNVVPW